MRRENTFIISIYKRWTPWEYRTNNWSRICYGDGLISIRWKSQSINMRHSRSRKIPSNNSSVYNVLYHTKYIFRHYRGSLGALVVYDVTNKKTFDNVLKWIEELKNNTDPDVVIFLVGNKVDEVLKRPDKRKVTYQEA